MRAPLWQGKWTQARLQRIMRLRFGTSRTGGVDTVAAATELGVSPRTVRRWLQGSARSLTRVPPHRLKQIITPLQPSEELLIRETQKDRYARAALLGPTQPAWITQGWMEPHLVAVVQIQVNNHTRIRQLAITRATSVKGWAEIKHRGKIIDQVTVPTRFHATVVSQQVLESVKPWRFIATPKMVAHSHTQTWTADAPPTRLSAVAVAVLAELPQPPAVAPKDPPPVPGPLPSQEQPPRRRAAARKQASQTGPRSAN